MILVINCGSSSAKFQLFNPKGWKRLAKGVVERIGQNAQTLTLHKGAEASALTRTVRCPDHHLAIKEILLRLEDPKRGVLKSREDIRGVGHRVVHGGEHFKESVIITSEVIATIEKYNELAPLHNPHAASGMRACLELLGNIPQVAAFDTSFHQTIPPQAYIYGLPYSFYKDWSIRRYGFHGTSHRFVSEEAARELGRPLKKLKLITCHLGNGCSMTAVDRGRSVDTTMGFTPLEGLVMGTRSGDIDAAIVLHLAIKKRFTPETIEEMLNKESGLLGISEKSNDMRDLLKAVKAGDKKAELAIDVFVYRIKKYIGAYYAAMGGLDAVVFTAGIGENSPWLIKRLLRELKGVVGRHVRFMSIPTNEELLIAKDTYALMSEKA